MQTVVVDYRNICKIQSYSIFSGNIPSIFPTEFDEIQHRIAKRLFCIREEYPDAIMILAADTPPYWRHRWLNKWYSEQGLEPVEYKGTRAKRSWNFETPKESMDSMYEIIYEQVGNLIGAYRICSQGLEADDIWGIIATVGFGEIIGISTDSDWQQMIGKFDNRRVVIDDPVKNIVVSEKADITMKLIAGEAGDNIIGCPKIKKDGTSSKNWGIDGVKTLLKDNPDDWREAGKIDKKIVERNRMVIQLPCPMWNISDVAEELNEVTIAPVTYTEDEQNALWHGYGMSVRARELYKSKAERDKWLTSLRLKMIDMIDKAPKAKTLKAAEEQSGAPLKDADGTGAEPSLLETQVFAPGA